MEESGKQVFLHSLCEIIMIKEITLWKVSDVKLIINFQHNGLPPQNYKEKNQLKQMIKEGN